MNNLIMSLPDWALFVAVMTPVTLLFGAVAVVFGRFVDAEARYRQHAGEDFPNGERIGAGHSVENTQNGARNHG